MDGIIKIPSPLPPPYPPPTGGGGKRRGGFITGERVRERVNQQVAEKLTALAKNLRKQSTDTEQVLWKYLRAKRLYGLKFKRQQPIGNYIVDFVCFEREIIIELDGGQHAQPEQMQKDRERDRWFERQGYEVLRFWDNEVLKNIRGVLEVIWEKCLNHPPLNPLPSREGK